MIWRTQSHCTMPESPEDGEISIRMRISALENALLKSQQRERDLEQKCSSLTNSVWTMELALQELQVTNHPHPHPHSHAHAHSHSLHSHGHSQMLMSCDLPSSGGEAEDMGDIPTQAIMRGDDRSGSSDSKEQVNDCNITVGSASGGSLSALGVIMMGEEEERRFSQSSSYLYAGVEEPPNTNTTTTTTKSKVKATKRDAMVETGVDGPFSSSVDYYASHTGMLREIPALSMLSKGSWLYKYPRRHYHKLIPLPVIPMNSLSFRFFWLNPLRSVICWSTDPMSSELKQVHVMDFFLESRLLPRNANNQQPQQSPHPDPDGTNNNTNAGTGEDSSATVIIVMTNEENPLTLVPTTNEDLSTWIAGLRALVKIRRSERWPFNLSICT